MRAFVVLLAVLAAAILPLSASAAEVAASSAVNSTLTTSTHCATPWGSLAEGDLSLAGGGILDVRAGRHACFDRLVIEVAGPAGGWRAGYVGQVTADGSGQVVPVAGGARLQLVVGHPGYDLGPVGAHLVGVAGFATLRGVVDAGSFEGQTTIGVGVRARLPFRVFALAGPGGHSRIVLDVAHRWS